MLNLRDLSTWRHGSNSQRQAFSALQSLNVFSRLGGYDPVLASTHAIGLDTAESDIDIICEAPCLESFDATVREAFGGLPGFKATRSALPRPASTATFRFRDFAIEIYGDDLPVEQQNAFRHLMICHRLLQLCGPRLRAEIKQQRLAGAKMEAAFAQQLGLRGDPYSELLKLEHEPDSKLAQHLNPKGKI